MRYRRVLLLRPPFDGRYRAYLPTGLAWLAEALGRAGIEYRVLDFDLGATESELQSCLEDFRPELVAMGMSSFRYRHSLRLLASCRRDGGPDLLVGGPHVSAFRDRVFDEAPWLDWALLGEGERSFPMLCRGDAPSAIPGLLWPEGGSLRSNPPAWIDDLDTLPFPRYEGFSLEDYPSEIIGLVTSRGCPHACLFCNVSSAMGRRHRRRSAGHVAAEVAWWMERGRRVFSILDDGFTEDRAHAEAVCRALEVHGRRGARFLCGNGLRADHVDAPLLRRMAAAGFETLSFGAESGDPAVRRRLGKPAELASLRRAVRQAHAAGIDVKLHFVVGGPGESEDSFERSLALAWNLPLADVSFNNLVPYPATALERLARRKGWLVEEGWGYLDRVAYHGDEPVLETPEFSLEARRRALRRARRFEQCLRRRHWETRLRPRWGLVAPLLSVLLVSWGAAFLRSRPRWKRRALGLARFLGLR